MVYYVKSYLSFIFVDFDLDFIHPISYFSQNFEGSISMDMTFLNAFMAWPSPDTQELPTKFSGVSYSGGVVPGYGALGDVIIDLDTMRFPSKRLFALVNHDPNQRAGNLTLYRSGDQLAVDGEFMKTTAGVSVASEYAQGAPWELSIKATGTRRPANKSVKQTINGHDVYVDNVIVDSIVREVSFVPAGADPNTHSIAFSLENIMKEPDIMSNGSASVEMDTQVDDRIQTLQMSLTAVTTERDAALEALNVVKLELSAAKIALDAIAHEKRKEQIRLLFNALHRDWDEDRAEAYFKMDDVTFSLLQSHVNEMSTLMDTEKANKLEPTLTTELAVNGMDETNPLDKIVAEIRRDNPTISIEMAVSRALQLHPELYTV